jgi:hypothetical protein
MAHVRFGGDLLRSSLRQVQGNSLEQAKLSNHAMLRCNERARVAQDGYGPMLSKKSAARAVGAWLLARTGKCRASGLAHCRARLDADATSLTRRPSSGVLKPEFVEQPHLIAPLPSHHHPAPAAADQSATGNHGSLPLSSSFSTASVRLRFTPQSGPTELSFARSEKCQLQKSPVLFCSL